MGLKLTRKRKAWKKSTSFGVTLKTLQFVVFGFIMSTTLPLNIDGKLLKPPHIDSKYPLRLKNVTLTDILSSKIMFNRTQATKFHEDQTDRQNITGILVFFSMMSFIISTALFFFMISYLNNVSLAKQGVLVCLYKDVLAILVSLNCLWMLGMILCFCSKHGNNMGLFEAKILSFCMWCLLITLLLLIIVISCIKFYVKKEKMLDPPMPWGDNETLGVRSIRLSCSLVSGIFTSTMYGLKLHPRLYHLFVGNFAPLYSFSGATLIFPGVFIGLLVTYTIVFGGTEFCQSCKTPPNDSLVFRQLNWFFCMTMISLLLILPLVTFKAFELDNPWIIVQLQISMTHGIIAIIIVSTHQLKSYILKQFEKMQESAFLLSIYVVPGALMVLINTGIYIVYKAFDM